MTGVHYIGKKKVLSEKENHLKNPKRYLSSIENVRDERILKSASKKISATPSSKMIFSTKSPFPSSLVKKKSVGNASSLSNFSCHSLQPLMYLEKTTKTPSPPLSTYRNRLNKVIHTPEPPPDSSFFRKRYSTISTETSSSVTSEGNYAIKNMIGSSPQSYMAESNKISPKLFNRSLKDDVNCAFRKKIESKYSFNINNDYTISNCINGDNAIKNGAEGDKKFMQKNHSFISGIDNSFEATYMKANGTYDIINTDEKKLIHDHSDKLNQKPHFIVNENKNELQYACNKNSLETLESVNVIKNVNDTVDLCTLANHDESSVKPNEVDKMSPSFVLHKNLNSTFDIDDSTDTFVFCESFIKNSTMMECKDNDVNSPLANITVKKKLSLIPEESAIINNHSTVKKSYSVLSIPELINQTEHLVQITSTSNNDVRMLHSKIDLYAKRALNKLSDTLNMINNFKQEKGLYFQKQDSMIETIEKILNNMKAEKQQYLTKKCDIENEIFNSLDDIQKELNSLMNLTSKSGVGQPKNSSAVNDDHNISLLSGHTSSLPNLNNTPSAGVLTPVDSDKTVSKSVYNKLKNQFSYLNLETPNPSTLKKNLLASNKKVLTPHSMSICVQDQIDQLFD